MAAIKTRTNDSTTARVLDTFRALDPATPREIANTLGLDRATVEEALKKLAEAGEVLQMNIWTLTPARRAKNREGPTRAGRAAAIIAEQDGRTVSGRRAKGVLEEEITAYMVRRAGADVGPAEVSRSIGAKSGAVYPAMERMLAKGDLVKSQEKPVRYRLAVVKKARPE